MAMRVCPLRTRGTPNREVAANGRVAFGKKNGGDGERRADEQLPGVEEGEEASELFFAVEMFQVGVGAAGFWISGSEFAPD
jgi:hypothetical protein